MMTKQHRRYHHVFLACVTTLFWLPSPTLGFLSLSSSREQQHQQCSRIFHPHPTITTTTTQLFENQEPSQRGSIRFSASDYASTDYSSSTTSSVDRLLSYIFSDLASIALGALGLMVVVIHRLSFLDNVDTMGLQTRTDLLAVFACGSVLLNGITKLDVTAALAESVVLEGRKLETPEVLLDTSSSNNIRRRLDSTAISWGLESLLTATPAQTAVLLVKHRNNDPNDSKWTVVARAGMVPSSSTSTSIERMMIPETTPILDRVGSPKNVQETYLPTLQALPGRLEFTYLPSNTQLVLLIPVLVPMSEDENDMESSSVLVLGGSRSKSFTPRDVAWCRIVAERMAAKNE